MKKTFLLGRVAENLHDVGLGCSPAESFGGDCFIELAPSGTNYEVANLSASNYEVAIIDFSDFLAFVPEYFSPLIRRFGDFTKENARRVA